MSAATISFSPALVQPKVCSQGTGHCMLAAAFRTASWLTEPVCKMHELYRRIHVVDLTLGHTASKVERWARKSLLFCGSAVCGLTAVVASPLGIAIRFVACKLQKNPYLHFKGRLPEQKLGADRSFTHLEWNDACCSGGYTMTDGQVWPWAFRVDKEVIQGIEEVDVDTVTLFEVETEVAFRLYEKMKDKYAHFFFNIGPTAVGVSSWTFAATKFGVEDARFKPFPKSALLGRTAFAEKGVFSYSLKSQKEKFATIVATHMQDSIVPADPQPNEIKARKLEMEFVMDRVHQVKEGAVVVTGDFNADDDEFQNSDWYPQFTEGNDFKGEKTWGGSGVCAPWMGLAPSGPLNLDRTMIKKGTAKKIVTTLGSTTFNGNKFGGDSDHRRLISRIWV